ncbi:MAG: hypothetical protein AVDCRST_MAG27-1638, partial [uncultured Craurococcus sp.]
ENQARPPRPAARQPPPRLDRRRPAAAGAARRSADQHPIPRPHPHGDAGYRQRLPLPRHQPDTQQLGLPGHGRRPARERRLCGRLPQQCEIPRQPLERHPPGARPAGRLPLRTRGRRARPRLHRLSLPGPGQGPGRPAERVPGGRHQGRLHHRHRQAARLLQLLPELLRPLGRRLLRRGRRRRDAALRLHGVRPPRPSVDRAQPALRHAGLPVVLDRRLARDLCRGDGLGRLVRHQYRQAGMRAGGRPRHRRPAHLRRPGVLQPQPGLL